MPAKPITLGSMYFERRGDAKAYLKQMLNKYEVGDRVSADDEISISIDVTNTGRVAGEETVLAFFRDPVASVSRPVLQLAGLAKARLAPGETKTVQLKLRARDMSFPDHDGSSVLEPGVFQIFVGPSARESDLLKADIMLVG